MPIFHIPHQFPCTAGNPIARTPNVEVAIQDKRYKWAVDIGGNARTDSGSKIAFPSKAMVVSKLILNLPKEILILKGLD